MTTRAAVVAAVAATMDADVLAKAIRKQAPMTVRKVSILTNRWRFRGCSSLASTRSATIPPPSMGHC
uniref:Putative secreted peptide n=1 Tax=Anopheles braziliensis TaxID=58242 RepID=A0A2M3ZME3_9DIPT